MAILTILMACLGAIGCASPKTSSDERDETTEDLRVARTEPPLKGARLMVASRLSAAPAAEEDPASEYPLIVPLPQAPGRVVQVNTQARFVVIDFSVTRLPARGTYLTVYRGGDGVGRVRISRWIRGVHVAADIMEGVAAPGDRVGSVR